MLGIIATAPAFSDRRAITITIVIRTKAEPRLFQNPSKIPVWASSSNGPIPVSVTRFGSIIVASASVVARTSEGESAFIRTETRHNRMPSASRLPDEALPAELINRETFRSR